MEYSNILVIKMSSLGDVIHTLPFVAALRKRFPKAKITWLVQPQFAAFLPEPPMVDEIIYFDKARFLRLTWGEKWQYFKKMHTLLRQPHFDLVLDMQGLFKSAVLAFLTGCPTRLGYCQMREGSGLVSKAIVGAHAHEHVIERYLDVARYLGAQVDKIEFPLPSLAKDWERVKPKLICRGWQEQKSGYVVLVPGARWQTKIYPPLLWAELAGLLCREGTDVVLAGSPEDIPLGEQLTQSWLKHEDDRRGKLLNLIGQTDLRELGALIQHSKFYFSADTGPLFIATALKKPLAAVYGPTRPERTGPYGFKGATVLAAPVPCAGCLRKECDHWHCMASVTPAQLYQVYQKALGRTEHGT